jgi:undecaprenyl diphosphate synthase
VSQHTPSSKTLHVAASHPLGTVTAEEAYLFEKLDLNQLPRHLAVIMDGNGRWAEKRHLPRIAGHKAGTETARTTIETCARLKIQALTLYAFSVENWRRPKTETDFLMQLLREYLRQEMPLIQKNNIRMRFLGRPDDLPEAVQRDTRKAELETVNEILREKAGKAAGRVTEEEFSEKMYTTGLPDPDLLIRTSGEMRVSNFLLWQIAYAEIYVTETLWPDFNRARLLEAFVDFQKRERRYGGIGQVKTRKPAAGE